MDVTDAISVTSRNPLFEKAMTREEVIRGVKILTIDLKRRDFQIARVNSVARVGQNETIYGTYLRVFTEFKGNTPPPYLHPFSMGITPIDNEWMHDTFSLIPSEETIPDLYALLATKDKQFALMAAKLWEMYPQYLV